MTAFFIARTGARTSKHQSQEYRPRWWISSSMSFKYHSRDTTNTADKTFLVECSTNGQSRNRSVFPRLVLTESSNNGSRESSWVAVPKRLGTTEIGAAFPHASRLFYCSRSPKAIRNLRTLPSLHQSDLCIV